MTTMKFKVGDRVKCDNSCSNNSGKIGVISRAEESVSEDYRGIYWLKFGTSKEYGYFGFRLSKCKGGKIMKPTHIVVWDTESCGDPHFVAHSLKEIKQKVVELTKDRDVVQSSIRVFQLNKELEVKTRVELGSKK